MVLLFTLATKVYAFLCFLFIFVFSLLSFFSFKLCLIIKHANTHEQQKKEDIFQLRHPLACGLVFLMFQVMEESSFEYGPSHNTSAEIV